MESSPKQNKYYEQRGIANTLYNCEPEGYNGLVTSEEMAALSKYYFVDREVDVDDLSVYQANLQKDEPELVTLAESALHKIARAYKVSSSEIDAMFN